MLPTRAASAFHAAVHDMKVERLTRVAAKRAAATALKETNSVSPATTVTRRASPLSKSVNSHWFVAPASRLVAPQSRQLSTAAADLVNSGDDHHHKSGSKALWGGRFTKGTDESVKSWVDSTPIDKHMGREDMWGSIAQYAPRQPAPHFSSLSSVH
jgi:argininosuccinate lyase